MDAENMDNSLFAAEPSIAAAAEKHHKITMLGEKHTGILQLQQLEAIAAAATRHRGRFFILA